jgi:hypothetical protein
MHCFNAAAALVRICRDRSGSSTARAMENNNDPKIITESQQYLRDFTRIAAEETTAAGVVARMVERYPDWENLRTLWHSARSAIARKNG